MGRASSPGIDDAGALQPLKRGRGPSKNATRPPSGRGASGTLQDYARPKAASMTKIRSQANKPQLLLTTVTHAPIRR